ncbi:MAG: type II secretion system protein [Lentisphaeria bacterium]|nr:type II secretion system protein [Lentisphaeria bacterium]
MKIKRKFTLVELLAAMAVFSVLLLVSMRLFSGAQNLWLNAEQKSRAFSDARVAMELIAARIQTLVYYENVPFSIDQNNNYIWFAGGMTEDVRNDSTSKNSYYRFVKFLRNNNGYLEMRTFSAKHNQADAFKRKYFPPFDTWNGSDESSRAEHAWDDVESKLQSTNSSDVDVVTLIGNVTDFKLSYRYIKETYSGTASDYEVSYAGLTQNSDSSFRDLKTPPYWVEIEISMMDTPENYDKWENASGSAKDEIFREHGHTFRRLVFLGKKIFVDDRN